MGNELDPARLIDAFYLSGDWDLYVGDWYRAALAKRNRPSSWIFALNTDNAVFQKDVAKKVWPINYSLKIGRGRRSLFL